MQLDLNLLTALDALLEENSVGAAAERLHLSAPALSRTLGRIRRATGDQILVRTGRSMTPTPYALKVREHVHDLVQQAQAVLSPEQDLDLARIDRTFVLRCHDAVTTAIAPTLLATVHAQASGVSLRLLAEASTDTNDLRHGQVELEIGSTEPVLPEIRHELIAQDHLVLAARSDHPCLSRRLTTARYADAQHITVSRRGRLRDRIDDVLGAGGFTRTVVAAAPTSTAALHIVRHSDLVVAVPEQMCRSVVHTLGLKTAAIPLDLPPVPVVLAWHQRYESDKAHRWLREQVRQTLQAVCTPAPRRSGRAR